MNAMVPGLSGGKMSSSDPNSKIDILDSPDVVRSKIKKAVCEPGTVAGNGVLAFLKAVLIPISELRIERMQGKANVEEGQDAMGDQRPFAGAGAPEGTVFSVEMEARDGGGFKHYKSYDEVEKDYAEEKLYPKPLKTAVADAINRLLDPIRKAFAENEEWQKVEKLAYPDPKAKPEGNKKKKVSLVLWES